VSDLYSFAKQLVPDTTMLKVALITRPGANLNHITDHPKVADQSYASFINRNPGVPDHQRVFILGDKANATWLRNQTYLYVPSYRPLT
jgi:hypothetical protein